ncbi:RNA polymerase sigma-70 factor [Chitinophaga barathri]|uniref:RNA polymerase sigma-70 factor n=1 Tax=Chitinophaga barathri TaxID=1647451 RepID=A0A3N4MJU3_9BACT|nr:RNA polymerase sigma-70 factor [Chitinophaga barathri]RPD42157.1 RNA polymerase sigma-70 factor [Chitinophaga barathri]
MYAEIQNETYLLHEMAAGNQQALKAIVEAFWPNIYAHALAYLRSPEKAEELTQDVFIAIWEKRSTLPGIENFRGYLFITARNKIISRLREKLGDELTGDEADAAETLYIPDSQLELKELNSLLRQGIAQLPPKRQRVFEMSRLEGKSHAEIAAELNISKDTVSEYITLALNFLRTYLKNNGNHLHIVIFCLYYI